MAAVSNSKYDVYQWIIKIYDSCQTLKQVQSADKFLVNFYKRYKDVELYKNLQWYSYNKLHVVTSKQLKK